MKKYFFILFFAFAIAPLFSQNPKNIKIVPSVSLFEKGSQYIEKEEFEKSILQFIKIPEGDTLYSNAQFYMALAYYYTKQNENAIICLKNVLKNLPENIPATSIYNVLGYVYISNNQFSEATQILEKSIQIAPYNYRILTILGTAYMELNQLVLAEQAIQKSIFCAPTNQYSHFLLGKLYLKQGKMAPAILAFNYTVFLNPKSDQAIEALQTLNELLVNFHEVSDNLSITKNNSKDTLFIDHRFTLIDELVCNNYPITKKFKLKSEIDHIIVRQTQFVFENLPHSNGSKNVLDYVYIPFFKSIMGNDQFNTYSYYLLSGTNINENKVLEKAKKMEKKINKLKANGFTMLQEQIKYGIGIENTGTPKMEFEYNEEDQIESLGGYTTKNKNGDKLFQGQWTVIDENGSITSILELKDTKKNGICRFYEKGYETQVIPYINDSINGTAKAYFPTFCDSKKTSLVVPFIQNQIHGIRKEYSRSGVLLEEKEYRNDYLDGTSKIYDFHGQLSALEFYKEGNPNGIFEEYYPNGIKSAEYHYKDDPSEVKKYYPDGTLKMEGSMISNMMFGTVKSYYPNGKIEYIGSYNEIGEEDGFWTLYYKNGTISEEFSFVSGQLNGDHKLYTPSGFLCALFQYTNGQLKEVKTFLPNHETREIIQENEGVFQVDVYNESGILFQSNIYEQNGDLTGISTQYYPTGVIQKTTPYTKDIKNGIETEYYKNGKIKSITTYKNDIEDGLFIQYFANDSIQKEGLYQNGKQIGIWYYYDINGAIESIETYQNGFISQTRSYYPDGNIKNEMNYQNGLLQTVNTFDHQNKVMKTDHFEEGNGIFRQYFLNGNVKSEGRIIANHYCDSMVEYNIQGERIGVDYYISGLHHGPYQFFDHGFQTILNKGNTILNQFHGVVHSYSHNKIIHSTEQYELGSLEGVRKIYSDQKISAEHHYLENSRNGISEYYAADGKTLMYRLKYINDDIAQYSFLKKNQKMSDWILVTKDSTNIVAFYPNLQLSGSFSLKNGERNGKEVSYYPNGKIFFESEMKDNLMHGKSIYYYENGKIRAKEHFNYDLLHGPYQMYFENGNLEMEGTFYNHLPHGIFKYYDSTGVLTKEIEFYYGNILTQK